MLRDQLLRDVGNLNSAEGAAVWARRILPAKNTLHEADARQVEDAFEARLTSSTARRRPRNQDQTAQSAAKVMV